MADVNVMMLADKRRLYFLPSSHLPVTARQFSVFIPNTKFNRNQFVVVVEDARETADNSDKTDSVACVLVIRKPGPPRRVGERRFGIVARINGYCICFSRVLKSEAT